MAPRACYVERFVGATSGGVFAHTARSLSFFLFTLRVGVLTFLGRIRVRGCRVDQFEGLETGRRGDCFWGSGRDTDFGGTDGFRRCALCA